MELYLKEIEKTPLLPEAKERELLIAANIDGNTAAREHLIRANLRFVIKIAKQYAGQGMPLEDLISEGNVGLIIGIDRFDVERQVRLISYAVWWIRQCILQALSAEMHAVKVPPNRINEKLKYRNLYKQLSQELGREPSQEEVLEKFDIKAPVELSYVSLDKKVTEDSNAQLVDLIEDTSAEPPYRKAVINSLRRDLEGVLDGCTEREKEIIYLYHGIDELRGFTLEEIGSFVGLTRERVRQIKKKVLTKISKTRKGKDLKLYLDEFS